MSKTGSRITALALLVLVVVALFRVVGWPRLQEYRENRANIAQSEDAIAKYSQIAGSYDALQAELSSLRADPELGQFMLPEDSDTLAAASLQERVKSIVEATGGSLTSTRVLQSEQEQGTRFQRVSVNVRMSVTVETLQRVLHELESGVPYLIVDDVIVLARGGRRAKRVRLDLDVRFTLSGFRPSEAPPAGEETQSS